MAAVWNNNNNGTGGSDQLGNTAQSLYNCCLEALVANLNKESKSICPKNWCLPFAVLSDLLCAMALDKSAHDILKRQLQNIPVFGRLLDYSPGRQKLFKCLSALVWTHKTIIQDLAQSYFEYVDRRYEFVEYVPKLTLERLSKPQERLYQYEFFHYEDEFSDDEDLEYGDEDMKYEKPLDQHEFFFYKKVSTESWNRIYVPNSESTLKNPSLSEDVLKISDRVWEVILNSAPSPKREIEEGGVEEVSESDSILDDLIGKKEVVYLVRKASYLRTIDIGMRLGTFLAEAGWLGECISVLEKTLLLIECLGKKNFDCVLLTLDCLQRILNAQSRFCQFAAAQMTSNRINLMVEWSIPCERQIPPCLLAKICKERSLMYFARSEYDLSYKWSVRALKLLRHPIPERIKIEVLRQAGKSCVVKRQFKRANILTNLALKRTLAAYGKNHQKYADALLDYGFYLLNVDSIIQSVNAYFQAMAIKLEIFGELNLYVAIAHEDLAYALYVKEYSSGEFFSAREHIEKAILIMKKLVPSNHLLLASAKRVMALILEEIALDNTNMPEYEALLRQSEELHQSALTLSLYAFGEINVQTAKHYGNLGRLYQSMMKFEEAERMHKKAIKIKTDLLGAYDYEVGLSIGHLASLYNYQMLKHREAEELYKKSIVISLRLFGETYSGLEYDYRGLCHIYESLHETEKYLEYSRMLDNWRNLRLTNDESQQTILVPMQDDASMEDVIEKFFELNSESEVTAPSGQHQSNIS